ncbi:nitrogen fixation protein FixH [Rhodobacteraceae bacterium CCMM004]|nr:nitrogen fixation protein FixH [Rhodobacteraceae bacterium CCMM004]
MTRKFTGWHMLAITCGGFAVIIAVNLTLAFQAVATFPGLETKNSYVASQKFEAERRAQDALRWDVAAEADARGVTLSIRDTEGRPVRPVEVSGILGRATHTGDDRTPEFRWTGTDLVAETPLEPGYWNLRLAMVAEDGTNFRRRLPLTVRRP